MDHERALQLLRRWLRVVVKLMDYNRRIVWLWCRVQANLMAPICGMMRRAIPSDLLRMLDSAINPSSSGSMPMPVTNLRAAAQRDRAQCSHSNGLRNYGNRHGLFRTCDKCGIKWKLRELPEGATGPDHWEELQPGASSRPSSTPQLLQLSAAPTSTGTAAPSRRTTLAPAAAAAAAAPTENNCPVCRGPMTVRLNKTSGEMLKGCSNYPRCKGTRPMAAIPLGHNLTISPDVLQQVIGSAEGPPRARVRQGVPQEQLDLLRQQMVSAGKASGHQGLMMSGPAATPMPEEIRTPVTTSASAAAVAQTVRLPSMDVDSLSETESVILVPDDEV